MQLIEWYLHLEPEWQLAIFLLVLMFVMIRYIALKAISAQEKQNRQQAAKK